LLPAAALGHAPAVATRVELLSNISLFALMDERELASLAERLDEVERPEGTPLFHAGDPGDAAYVVLEGDVEIFFKNATGERVVLETIKSGGLFGEISLLDSGPRTASAMASTNVRLLVIDHGDIEQFLIARPQASLHLLAAMGRRLRESNRLLRGSASRNVNIEHEDKRSMVQKGADWISDFSGSLPFLFIHVAIFAFWIGMNVEPLASTEIGGWDAYPFGLLTMSVSLEAIILSVFVLLSQNRQVARDRVRNDIEYDINLKAELEIAQLHEKFDQLYEELQKRLANLERGQQQSLPPKVRA
jgi:CRP/FNR family transcriptional regulator, cyclic AMP receptor protein